jgi:PAS domain S-box-containing protein
MIGRRMGQIERGIGRGIERTQLRSYGIAFLSVAIALAVTLLLRPWLSSTPTPLFILAVMASAWCGNWKAGILAGVLSTLTVNYFFIEPFYSLHLLDPGTLIRLSTFLAAAGLISLNQSRLAALKQVKENLQALQVAIEQEQAASAEAKMAREHLETVFSRINNGVYVLDRNWRFTYVNDRLCKMFQMQQSALLGQNAWELFPEVIDTDTYVQFHRAICEQISLQFDALDLRCNRWYEHRVYPSSTGLTIFITEITAAKHEEAARRQAELNDQFLNQLDTRLRQLSDPDQMVWETISQVGIYLNADRCLWHAIDLDQGLAIVEHDWQQQEVSSVVGIHRLADFILPDLISQYQRGQAVAIADVTTDAYTTPLASNYPPGTRALIAVPCMSAGQWAALLVVSHGTMQNWRSDQVTLLQQIAARFWPVIEYAKAVQQLRQSEAEFRHLANAMPQIVWISNADRSLEFINDRWTEYTGLTLEQSRDRALIEQIIPPEDIQQLNADSLRDQEMRSPYQSQFRLLQPDGSYLHFLTRAVPLLDEHGQVCKWYGTSTDITALKQLEADLRQKNAILNVINESTPTPIFVKDRQGKIIFANPATLEVLGKSATEVIGYRDCDLYPSPEDAARVMENDRRIMESEQMEVVEESPDGIRTFLGMKVPYRNEAGEVIGLIGISNDITDRVQIERDRERLLQREQAAREAAENANRLKDEFLAMLSHELRSPLNPILGWSKLLQSRKFDQARTAEALATIERNAKLQSELIEDLLDVSRILQGKLRLNPCPVSLVTTIQAGLETVRLAAEAKSIQIETDLDTKVGLVSGDAARLQQVVWNLLSNAVKFTPNGGKVEVRLECTKDHAQITVCDTGKGIDPNFLPHVFEYFRQEDGATTRKFGGLGLGLAIVHHLIELHGGTVQADSLGEGMGATFTVRLPLLPIQSPVNLDCQVSELLLDLNGVQVLVIDDEIDSREFVAFVLEQAGARVRTAASAGEGLAALMQFKPDVLLSDIGMPDMDGYMLIRQIRTFLPEQGGETLAIALTAYAGDFNQQQAVQAGFQCHLAKPIEPNRLVEAVATLIGRNSSVSNRSMNRGQI